MITANVAKAGLLDFLLRRKPTAAFREGYADELLRPVFCRRGIGCIRLAGHFPPLPEDV